MDIAGTTPSAPGALEVLDVAAIRRWSALAVDQLERHRAEIDGLNVFPVADRDTGTNLSLTLVAAHQSLELDTDATTAAEALRALAVGAALGAQGNSGAIVSQVLRGIAEAAGDATAVDGVALSDGLLRGAELARAAVVDPVEGTILSVAAAAAAAASAGAGLAEVVVAAVQAAVAALEHTPDQLALLADQGVVDAGGRGLVLLLDALAEVVTGEPVAPPGTVEGVAHDDGCAAPDSAFGFEVQYLVDGSDAAMAALRARLSQLGDSVVVAGTGSGTWKVHAHVDDVGAAIEAGIQVGRPRDVSVVRFADQMGRHGHERSSRPAGAPGTAVVALGGRSGLGHLFRREGVHVLDESAGADHLGAELAAVAADGIVLLTNSAESEAVANAGAAIARRRGARVVVVPTGSAVQGLAAVAVHDPARRFDDDVVAMAEAAAATRSAEVLIADEDALTSVGPCRAGDVLGLIDGEVVQVGHSRLSVAFALLDRLLGIGVELVTIVVGEGLSESTGGVLHDYVRERSPLTEVVVYAGGPAHRPLQFGAE
ncbi:MAG: DAK2 domain-containing protein [Jatrophihabitans sp.]|uniref:DAK2 domain-containing protein n=1 Tax=Jatrophihabitans sp. TaxID=1932789 RepID=UPI003F819107